MFKTTIRIGFQEDNTTRALILAIPLTLAMLCAAKAQDAKPDPPLLKEIISEFPVAANLEARILTATIQPGATSPWHTHAAPVIVYILEGEFTLELDGKDSITKKVGEAMLEPINVKMRAANRSSARVKF